MLGEASLPPNDPTSEDELSACYVPQRPLLHPRLRRVKGKLSDCETKNPVSPGKRVCAASSCYKKSTSATVTSTGKGSKVATTVNQDCNSQSSTTTSSLTNLETISKISLRDFYPYQSSLSSNKLHPCATKVHDEYASEAGGEVEKCTIYPWVHRAPIPQLDLATENTSPDQLSTAHRPASDFSQAREENTSSLVPLPHIPCLDIPDEPELLPTSAITLPQGRALAPARHLPGVGEPILPNFDSGPMESKRTPLPVPMKTLQVLTPLLEVSNENLPLDGNTWKEDEESSGGEVEEDVWLYLVYEGMDEKTRARLHRRRRQRILSRAIQLRICLRTEG